MNGMKDYGELEHPCQNLILFVLQEKTGEHPCQPQLNFGVLPLSEGLLPSPVGQLSRL